jgi:adenylyltransferase/sulfurtransferase
MPNFYNAPEISIQEVDRKLKANEKFILLDVREPAELEKARLHHPNLILTPLSSITEKKAEALPDSLQRKDQEIIVICHHGIRSALVTTWLLNEGWQKVYSMAGGLAAYASEIDPTIGAY